MEWSGRNAFFQILMYGIQIYVFLCYKNIRLQHCILVFISGVTSPTPSMQTGCFIHAPLLFC